MICQECKEEFKGAKTRKYCSKKCANQVTGRSKTKVRELDHTCQHCGVSFWAPPTNHQKFCSKTCAAIDRMGREEIRQAIYNDKVKAKISKTRKAFSSTEKGQQVILDCSNRMKSNNPMHSKKNIQKMMRTKTLNGTLHEWKGERGGNGKLTESQIRLSLALGWPMEVVICTGGGEGFPNSYKIDIADSLLKLAIEVDGSSHQSKENMLLDAKKTNKLNELGWKVLRFTNEETMTDLSAVLLVIKNEIKAL